MCWIPVFIGYVVFVGYGTFLGQSISTCRSCFTIGRVILVFNFVCIMPVGLNNCVRSTVAEPTTNTPPTATPAIIAGLTPSWLFAIGIGFGVVSGVGFGMDSGVDVSGGIVPEVVHSSASVVSGVGVVNGISSDVSIGIDVNKRSVLVGVVVSGVGFGMDSGVDVCGGIVPEVVHSFASVVSGVCVVNGISSDVAIGFDVNKRSVLAGVVVSGVGFGMDSGVDVSGDIVPEVVHSFASVVSGVCVVNGISSDVAIGIDVNKRSVLAGVVVSGVGFDTDSDVDVGVGGGIVVSGVWDVNGISSDVSIRIDVIKLSV